jgi:hypothetical protein
MNVRIGTEAAQFPEKEYIYGVFVAVPSTYKGSKLLRDPLVRSQAYRDSLNIKHKRMAGLCPLSSSPEVEEVRRRIPV